MTNGVTDDVRKTLCVCVCVCARARAAQFQSQLNDIGQLVVTKEREINGYRARQRRQWFEVLIRERGVEDKAEETVV